MTRARQNANLLAQTATGNINLSGVLTATSFSGDGSGLSGAGSTVADDTTTNQTFYPLFTQATSGTVSATKVSTTNLTFNPSTPVLRVGTGSTINGNGNVSFAGTINALDVTTQLKLEGFGPSDGATGVPGNTSLIKVFFNNAVGFGTTGFVRIEGKGKYIGTFGIGSTNLSIENNVLQIRPISEFGRSLPGAANTIRTIIDASVINSPRFTGVNTTGSTATYSFVIESAALGDFVSGGYLICAASGTQWLVAQSSTEVSRNWHSRNDATINAQSTTGCTGWFVPTCGQLQNPGFACRTRWGGYSNTSYWSSTDWNGQAALHVSMSSGGASRGAHGAGNDYKSITYCVRAFRCLTY